MTGRTSASPVSVVALVGLLSVWGTVAAAVIFGAWHPIGAAFAGLFFGFADAIGIQSQINITERVPREFVLMIPFVLTIFAVWLGGLWRRRSLEAEAGYAESREPDF